MTAPSNGRSNTGGPGTSRRGLRFFLIVLAAGSLGGLVALPLGDQRQLSIEAWLTAASTLLAMAVIARLINAAPVQSTPLAAVLRRRTQPAPRTPRLPRNLLPVEGLLLSARDNERAFKRRLQPRLIRLADHYLSTDHGAVMSNRTDGAADILGDSGWLIDPTTTDRTPTLSEIDRFFDRLLSQRTVAKGTTPHDR